MAENPTGGVNTGKAAPTVDQLVRLENQVIVAERQLAQQRDKTREVDAQLRAAGVNNKRMVDLLERTREEIIELKQALQRDGDFPFGYGTVISKNERGHAKSTHSIDAANVKSVDILQAGRKLRVGVSPLIAWDAIRPGVEVLLNEALVIVAISDTEKLGEVTTVKEVLDEERVLTVGRSDDQKVVKIGGALKGEKIRVGDSLVIEPKSGYAIERLHLSEVQSLILEEVPDISYENIGGLGPQITQIRDAVELPFLHADVYRDHGLKAPKGILLYGPPGCGKTLIAKAVASSLAENVAKIKGTGEAKSYFLNIKGPELLNKYVGETERHIRLIFSRAREKASGGNPVVVFFDEMDSLFRTRGTGVSSDVETTIVPQLLSEIDGVEKLDNVIVIGASNREDMIDPAILRPGRLDVKIKIRRPNRDGAAEIFSKHFTSAVPVHRDEIERNGGNKQAAIDALIEETVDTMYAHTPENQFIEITYVDGSSEMLYFGDFTSGAVIRNVVDRAKKSAIKSLLSTGEHGITREHLLTAVVDEFREHEDLPNTTNPDEWARISGRKGERIAHLRTIDHEEQRDVQANAAKQASRASASSAAQSITEQA
ncbi:proteasome-associated ATPase [Neomicrococcus aestuarii]|uniref:AAA ATPase forming ring-shaped complexes n=1 Tax=Neomicrococcus aestuarii TaxID=556325 RepID=A0A7W8TSD3_9MICC|nr:proteasome ATPase [Neomicrococcus aestuarii]MBB5511883.1 proteasome-associated ATPase [Neomicrococcus aestuarii]